MTKTVVSAAGVLQLVVGAWAVVALARVATEPALGMTAIFVPVLAGLTVFVLMGLCLLVRTRWTYALYVAAPCVVGLAVVLYLGVLSGPAGVVPLLLGLVGTTAVLVLPMRLPAVRRLYGV